MLFWKSMICYYSIYHHEYFKSQMNLNVFCMWIYYVILQVGLVHMIEEILLKFGQIICNILSGNRKPSLIQFAQIFFRQFISSDTLEQLIFSRNFISPHIFGINVYFQSSSHALNYWNYSYF